LEQERALACATDSVKPSNEHRHERCGEAAGTPGFDADLAVGAGECAGAAVGEGAEANMGAKFLSGLPSISVSSLPT
jgi:hypothetical protein